MKQSSSLRKSISLLWDRSDCSGYLPLVQSAMAVDGVTEQIQHQGPCLGEEREGREDWEEERMEGGRERGVAFRE